MQFARRGEQFEIRDYFYFSQSAFQYFSFSIPWPLTFLARRSF
jgi:hypothetical protein